LGRIRVLSDVVANKIAAGEVVERPASVVKELLENSLDAGATRLRIEVEAGGRRLIRVADDGCGMLRDDALLAFERHATSKLADVKDLLSISTLGFRGEALPSVASVSRLTLETRSADETTGSRVEIAGGKILRCDEAALAVGTTVTVRDLFFNVPARRKFLRSEQTELAHIASLATHYSLAHAGKALQMRHNNSDLLDVTPAASLRDRVFQVFGSQTLEELVELPPLSREIPHEDEDDDRDPSALRLSGFISRPQVQKLNRNSVFLFVNARLIRDRLLLHALNAAYHNIIPSHAYPFALLFLEMPYEEVDVNVHPSKTEVRFRRGSFVHDFVRDSLREALTAARPVPRLPLVTTPQPAAHLPYSEFTQALENETFRQPAESAQPGAAGADPHDAVDPLLTFALQQPTGYTPRLDFGGPPLSLDPPAPIAPRTPVTRGGRLPDTHGPLPEGAWKEAAGSLEALRDLRPIGQLHDSFIVAAGPDGLWIVDQHVAHERILFEKVLRQMSDGEVERQALLMPILLDLMPAQQVEYSRIAADLTSVGFEIEPFGPRTLAVKAAPADLTVGEVERVVFEILDIAEQQLRQASLEDFRRQMAASIACRAAIKINTPLETHRMLWLLSALAETEFPMSCPHGRPIALRYSTRDILKGFHRI
jgi:DNA mismatch repair protein MutL